MNNLRYLTVCALLIVITLRAILRLHEQVLRGCLFINMQLVFEKFRDSLL